jgi:phage-related protein
VAGPTIKVSFLSDFSKLKSSVADVTSVAKGAGSGMKDAFAPMLAALNKSGVFAPFKEALEGVGEALNNIKEHAGDIPAVMAGVGFAVAGIGTALQGLGSKDQAAHQQLQAAVAATGKAYDGYDTQVEEAIKHQEKFGNTAVSTQDALRVLTSATNDPKKALAELGTASDLAAAKHISLSSAAEMMAQAYAGNTRVLKQFGISVTSTKSMTVDATKATVQAQAADANLAKAKQKLADEHALLAGKTKLTTSEQIALRNANQAVTDATAKAIAAHKNQATAQANLKQATMNNKDAMTQLSDKLKGQASAAADTFGGKLSALKAKAEDNIATFGEKYGKSLQTAGAAMAGLGSAMKIGQGAMEAARAAALGTKIELGLLSAATKIQTAAQWLLNAAMDANPIVLLVVAIVALVAIIVIVLVKTGLLKQAWNDLKKAADVVWHGILDAVKLVWNWIKANWPLLLGILFGPIGLAAALIYKNFSTIKGYAMDALSFIKSIWSTLTGFFSGIVGGVERLLSGIWSGAKQAAADAISFIKGLWGGITGFFSGIVSGIRNTFSGIYDALAGPFQRAWGVVQGIVNDVKGAVSDATNAVKSLPGGGIVGKALGALSKLEAGGIVTSPTIALIGERGPEAVVPLTGPNAPRAMSGAPAVVIQHAEFSTELDVESFMRRVAWVASTQLARSVG